MPELTSAFRCVYPTIIVAAYDRAYLWDIPSGKLIQIIEKYRFIVSEDGNNHYLYVEISERHVSSLANSICELFLEQLVRAY
jgi:hypothetical protein